MKFSKSMLLVCTLLSAQQVSLFAKEGAAAALPVGRPATVPSRGPAPAPVPSPGPISAPGLTPAPNAIVPSVNMLMTYMKKSSEGSVTEKDLEMAIRSYNMFSKLVENRFKEDEKRLNFEEDERGPKYFSGERANAVNLSMTNFYAKLEDVVGDVWNVSNRRPTKIQEDTLISSANDLLENGITRNQIINLIVDSFVQSGRMDENSARAYVNNLAKSFDQSESRQEEGYARPTLSTQIQLKGARSSLEFLVRNLDENWNMQENKPLNSWTEEAARSLKILKNNGSDDFNDLNRKVMGVVKQKYDGQSNADDLVSKYNSELSAMI